MREFRKWSSVLYLNMGSYLDRELAPFEINNSQYFYILKICEKPGITQDCILATMHRSPSNVTRALAQLEEKGYIARKPSERDKRTCRLYPTPKATAAYGGIVAVVEESARKVLEPFTEEERALLPRLLERAARSAEALNRPAPPEQDEQDRILQKE